MAEIPGQYYDWVVDAAGKNSLEASLIAGIIDIESSWNPFAVNETSGATGLGQFLASTAEDEGLTDRTDAKSSIYALAAYLRKRINWVGGDVNKGIMGYGEGTVEYLQKVLTAQAKYSGGSGGSGVTKGEEFAGGGGSGGGYGTSRDWKPTSSIPGTSDSISLKIFFTVLGGAIVILGLKVMTDIPAIVGEG